MHCNIYSCVSSGVRIILLVSILKGVLITQSGQGRGGGRKVPALNSTFENFLAIKAIPTKCCEFY